VNQQLSWKDVQTSSNRKEIRKLRGLLISFAKVTLIGHAQASVLEKANRDVSHEEMTGDDDGAARKGTEDEEEEKQEEERGSRGGAGADTGGGPNGGKRGGPQRQPT